MSIQRFFGIFLLVAGAIALIVGMNATHSAAAQISSLFSGHYTRATAGYFFGGGAAVVVGLMLVLVDVVRKRA